MNINENNTVHLTDNEWNALDDNAKKRLKRDARKYQHSDAKWHFYFYGISDKQVATELCAHFGLKVTE